MKIINKLQKLMRLEYLQTRLQVFKSSNIIYVILVIFVILLIPTVKAEFSDVRNNNVNYTAINYVQEQGIVSGYPDGTYKPDKRINRAEFTKIIVNASQKNIVGSNCFPDVKNEWFAKYICTAKQKNIIQGYPNGSFQPANEINFAESAKIIVKAFDYKIDDQNNESWYHPYVQVLADKKSIPTTITDVSKKITRGEMAEMIYRLDNNITDSPSLTYDDLSPNETATGTGPIIGSCQIFPDDNPWNTDISAYPVHPNSAAFISSIGASDHLHADFGGNGEYGIPYVVVDGSQSKLPINFTDYGDESDPGPYPIPLNAPIENGSDRHVLVVDTNECKLYELYNAYPQNNSWDASCGAIYDLNSNELRPDYWTSADAAGLPILAGLVRYDEVQQGEVKHALRFTVSSTQKGFIHPATHYASSKTSSDLPPMGLRLRMKKDYDISSFTGDARIILEGLKKYGMIVADNGSDWFITGASDSRWDDEDLSQLKDVPGSAFEAVYTGDIIK